VSALKRAIAVPIPLLRGLAARTSSRVVSLALNPVLLRDARSFFRGRRAALLQLVYLLTLVIAMGIAALIYHEENVVIGYRGSALSEYGRYIFIGIFETQVVVVLLIVVAYSAASISLEREKQTYDMLAMSTLSSAEVVFGKVASITLLCYMLLLTSAPLAAFSLLFGGISPSAIALSYGTLALKIPLWAAIGVLASTLVGRSIPAYVTTLVALGAENFASLLLMGFQLDSPIGILNPFFGPFVDQVDFPCELLGRQVAPWLLSLPYHLLLTGLAFIGAAEAMLYYHPKRSIWLRSLLLLFTLFFAFMLTASFLPGLLSGARAPGMAPSVVRGILSESLMFPLMVLWAWACVLAPIFSSYPADPVRRSTALSSTKLLLSPLHWWRRDPRAGPGFSLLLWAFGLAGIMAAFLLARVLLLGAVPAAPSPWPALALALPIYALSIVAYAAWGTALAIRFPYRREIALASVLILLAVNSVGFIYILGYGGMRKPPRTPALVLASPPAAASTILIDRSRHSMFAGFRPTDAIIFGFGYSALLLAGAAWYVTRGRRARSPAEDTPAAPQLPPQPIATYNEATALPSNPEPAEQAKGADRDH
jgi:ABC-2 type transport system permease protein